MMDVDREFRMLEERVAIKANRLYMEALSRLWKVDIRTVFIWHAIGKV